MRHARGLLPTTLLMLAPLAVGVTGMAVMAYGLAQQDLRGGANDSPAALAADAVNQLDSGTAPNKVIPAERVDAAQSLDPFLMIFDDHGRLLASSATVDGQAPDYPTGVFTDVRVGAPRAPTWQPRPGLRFASVAARYGGGFVVAARSLRLVEARIDDLGRFALALWILTMAACAATAGVVAWILAARATI